MPEYSFDVVSEFNPAELTNAIDQARREVGTRFDFKDTATSYDHRGDVIVIESASEDLEQLFTVIGHATAGAAECE